MSRISPLDDVAVDKWPHTANFCIECYLLKYKKKVSLTGKQRALLSVIGYQAICVQVDTLVGLTFNCCSCRGSRSQCFSDE